MCRIEAVVERCRGDFDLALTALIMRPRPSWVGDVLAGKF